MGLSTLCVALCCLCLVSTSAGQKPNKEENKPTGRCSRWEETLSTQLTAPSNFASFLKTIGNNLPKLSSGCVMSFSQFTNVSAVADLMKVLNEAYDDLNPGTRQMVYLWIKRMYTQEDGPVIKNMAAKETDKKPVKTPGNIPENDPDMKPDGKPGDKPGKDDMPGEGKGKSNWITVNVLKLLGRFLLQAPISAIKDIGWNINSSLCSLYNDVTGPFDKFYDLNSAQANFLFQGLQKCNINITDKNEIAKLGQMACFFATFAGKLDQSTINVLMMKLKNCSGDVKNVYQNLMKSRPAGRMNAEELKKVGDAVVGFSVNQLGNLSKEAIQESLDQLKKVKGWSHGQKKALLEKVLDAADNAEGLIKLGGLVSALDSKALGKLKGSDLLEAFKSQDVSQSADSMQPVQKKSIVRAILKDKSINEALKELPPALISEISSQTLKNTTDGTLNLDILDKLIPWNMGQALVIIKKILKNLKTPEDIKKLRDAVTGLTCSNIESMPVDNLRALAANEKMTRDQVRCAAAAYFKALNKKLADLTVDEITEIPPRFLLFFKSFDELMNLTRPACSSVVSLLAQANPTLLPRSSARRQEILKFIKSCLKLDDTLTLNTSQVHDLGLAVCYFDPNDFDNMGTDVFQMAVDKLKDCGKFEGKVKESLASKIIATYGNSSTWTPDVLNQLQSLLSLFNSTQLEKLQTTADIRVVLIDILSRVKKPEGFVAPDLDFTPKMDNVSKVFSTMILGNQAATPSSKRRKRAAVNCSGVIQPTTDEIQTLNAGCIAFSPAQLQCMSTDTFTNTLDILASVKGFSMDQLTALKEKALQVYSQKEDLVKQISSLKGITLAFSQDEVNNYFATPNIDMLSAVGESKDWLSPAMQSRAKSIAENFLKIKPASSLTSSDLVGMRYFICVLSAEQIENISNVEYSTAVSNIGKLQCLNDVLTALKNKAVSTFGSPDTWSEDVVQDLGTIVARLNGSEISKLGEKVMPYLPPEAVSLIPPAVFKSLSAAQLRSLGTDNFAALSSDQRAQLDTVLLQALDVNLGAINIVYSAGHKISPAFAAITLALTLLTVNHL
ncbi:otoancorin-like [Acipenser oxyrinchus oxyrinchus]|uniref:Otoancorin-like n=1 Tax=Acipenser oxyrinchus oxyrinchus TaxID=40147 RepID=A0AAD8CZE7_ACIOX|nr:otoancorin-like [Acipenser oxyrinchus oxyrinchus]